MTVSFEMRRNDINKHPIPLAQLLEKFPFLGQYNQVHISNCLAISLSGKIHIFVVNRRILSN